MFYSSDMAVSNTLLEPGDRFAHILQPIKDLTKNWDIDIAACLEDYLEEVWKKNHLQVV